MALHPIAVSVLWAMLGCAATAQDAPEQATAPAQPGPRPPLSTQWDGALVDSANGTPFGETDGYRRLLRQLQTMPAEEAAKHVAVKLDNPQALADPDSQRGQWVRVRGLLVDLDAERLDQPLDGAVDVWRGWVSDTDGYSDPIAFDILDRPEGLELERDLVDVEGILYRTANYKTRDDKMRDIPWILARTVTRVDEKALPRAGVANTWAIVLIILALGFIGMRVFTIMRDRRRGDTRHRRDHGDAIWRAAAVHKHRPPERSESAPSPPTPSPPDTP
jgi:hypothetical protein